MQANMSRAKTLCFSILIRQQLIKSDRSGSALWFMHKKKKAAPVIGIGFLFFAEAD